jgi:hypothetical protein
LEGKPVNIEHYQLAERLLELYFIPGSTYYEGPVNVPNKVYRHIKREVTIDRIVAHIEGAVSIGAPSSHNGLVKWIAADIDSPESNRLNMVNSILREHGLPSYISLSGGKGYHLTVFFKGPVPLHVAQGIAVEIKRILDGAGLPYDKISPSPHGKGGDCIKLPLGIHPETGNRCYFLDDTLQPVDDSLQFVLAIETIDLNGSNPYPAGVGREVDIETGEIIPAPFPETISRRPCVNKLWREGLQAPNTRHRATCVIANAIARSGLIPPHQKEHALIEWAHRMFPGAREAGYLKVDSNLEFVVSEAKRLWRHYSQFGPYAELCENQVFKAAMRSACEDEFQCKLEQNHGHVNFNLLRRLGIFGAHNAKPKGIGKTAMAIYLAIEDIAEDFPSFQWNGMTVFSLSTQQLVCLANCTKTTVIKHRARLVDLGLLTKVPSNAIPTEVMQNVGHFRPNFYALPLLTEDSVRAMLGKLRKD